MTERPTFLKRQLLTATALSALALPLLAPAAQAEDIKRGGTLIMAREQEPQTLDPFVPNDNGSIFAIEMICDSLVEPDDTGYGLRPALAESWTTAEDGLSWTFTLRDAKFSDGTPVTIDDVVFSLNTLRQPERPMGFLLAPVKDVVAVDAKTLRIDLNTPYAPLPAALSAYAAAIVSKAAYEANPEAFGSAPVCAGPFKVDAFERGSLLAVSANPNYWDMGADGQPKPYLAGVEFRYVPETNSRVLGLQNGDLDLVSNVGFNNAKALMANSDLVVAPADVFKLEYVYLNHTKKPLDNKDFRLALNYAADREAILQAVYFGIGSVPNSYMPKVNFHSDAVPAIPFDIAKAKELVAASGYDGTPVDLMIDSGNATSRQIATILQQGWGEAGINVNIVEFDAGTAWGMVTKLEHTMYVSYITSDINDTDEIATLQADGSSGTNGFFSGYNNPDMKVLLDEARASSDPALRAANYAKVQETLVYDGYSVPLNFSPLIPGHQADVMGFKQLSTGFWWLQDVWLDRS